jgi:hypothetical protein
MRFVSQGKECTPLGVNAIRLLQDLKVLKQIGLGG